MNVQEIMTTYDRFLSAWEKQKTVHRAMKKECEKIATGEMQRQSEFDVDSLLDQRETVLANGAHVCPLCQCDPQASDLKLQNEYDEMREQYIRLESKYNTLRARELQMTRSLPKLAQYELNALPQPWTAHLHPLGRTYFFNHETGVSSWHDPRQMPSPNVEGCPPAFFDPLRSGSKGLGLPQPSEARLTGIKPEQKSETLLELQSYLPPYSYSPAAEKLYSSTQSRVRESGAANVNVDTPQGSSMRGVLFVLGPSLDPPRNHYSLSQKDEVETEVEGFEWDLRTVVLDGDRLWMTTSDTSNLPYEEINLQDIPGPSQGTASEDLPMESIQLWKARLEVLYPEEQTTIDVPGLLWGDSVSHGTKLEMKSSKNVGLQAGVEDVKNARPLVFEKSFKRWIIQDRLSRFWTFRVSTTSEARGWVVALTHNMLLIDSGRIRPSNFHFLPMQRDETAHSNTTAEGRVSQVENELKHVTKMMHHMRDQLRACNKAKQSQSPCFNKASDCPSPVFKTLAGPPMFTGSLFEVNTEAGVESRFKEFMAKTGVKIDTSCPSLNPSYVSFLRSQV